MMYLLDPEKPTVSYAVVGDRCKISARGTRYLVGGRGVDLADACHRAASEVGGRGGGHQVASGASISPGRLEDFLTLIDGIVGEQLQARAGNGGPQ
jgi:single-stranded DNA-specific DHH superfamily exonuclease